ncbi:hypothetical protein [Methanothermococcus sp.]|uniref:hypothetical protein n=1 Tax=Methanothermococcus sp. TaxID=2614238 RepID=UPI0025F5B5CA|nr:hypothetical protein [Methanothermococcus sp.]
MKKFILFLVLFVFLNPLFAEETIKYNISFEGMATNGTDAMISVYDKSHLKMYEILYDGKGFKLISEFPINKSELNDSKINFKPKNWNYYSYFKHPVVVGYFKGKWIFYNPEMLGFFDGKNFTTTVSGYYSGCSMAEIDKFVTDNKNTVIIKWRGSTTSCNGEWFVLYHNFTDIKNVKSQTLPNHTKDVIYNPYDNDWYIITEKSAFIYKNNSLYNLFTFPNNLTEQCIAPIGYKKLLISLYSKDGYCGLYLYNNGNLTEILNKPIYTMDYGGNEVLLISTKILSSPNRCCIVDYPISGCYLYKNGKIENLPDLEVKRVDYITYVDKDRYWLLAGVNKESAKLVKFNGNYMEDLTQQLVNIINGNNKMKNETNSGLYYYLYGLILLIIILILANMGKKS